MRGFPVEIKLENIPHMIRYSEKPKTNSDIMAVAFLSFLNSSIKKLLIIKKTKAEPMNTQLAISNSGKFSARVRLIGNTRYKTLMITFKTRKIILPTRTAARFWLV